MHACIETYGVAYIHIYIHIHEQTEAGLNVRFGKMDCTKYKSVCKRFDVTSYPSLKYISDGGKKVRDYRGMYVHVRVSVCICLYVHVRTYKHSQCVY